MRLLWEWSICFTSSDSRQGSYLHAVQDSEGEGGLHLKLRGYFTGGRWGDSEARVAQVEDLLVDPQVGSLVRGSAHP